LKELVQTNLLSYSEVKAAGHVIIEPATSDPKNRWWAVAQPLHSSQGRAFFINQTGIIHAATDAPWALESRVNRKTTAPPSGLVALAKVP
jgi:hypothetical protein